MIHCSSLPRGQGDSPGTMTFFMMFLLACSPTAAPQCLSGSSPSSAACLFCWNQELINLLLTGKAASNVFNDRVELDSGNGNITILKGVSSRSDVGLLSLFEHYEVCQVWCQPALKAHACWENNIVHVKIPCAGIFALPKRPLPDPIALSE